MDFIGVGWPWDKNLLDFESNLYSYSGIMPYEKFCYCGLCIAISKTATGNPSIG